MGQISVGILGGFSGKVGTVVGSNWRGLDTMRAKPKFKKNRKFSDNQLMQQSRFSVMTAFLAPIRFFLELGYRNFSTGQTGYNAALSFNMQQAITGEYPNFKVDYPQILLCDGMLTGAINATAANNGSGSLIFDWVDNSKPLEPSGPNATDDLMVITYCPATQEFNYSIGDAVRADGTYSMLCPSSFVSTPLHSWIAFKSKITKKVSKTFYLGESVLN
jgi:hypothetical protein